MHNFNKLIQFALLFIATFFCSIYATNTTDQQVAPKKIYMIMLFGKGETKVEKAFKEYFALKKKSVEFIMRDMDQDATKMPGFVDEIRKIKPDLIYMYGTVPALGVAGKWNEVDPAKHITDIPIVFTGASEPALAGIVKEYGPSGRNITGLSHNVPLETQLKTMKMYSNFKKIAVIFNPNEPQSKSGADRLESTGQKLGFETLKFPFEIKNGKPDPKSIQTVMAKLVEAKPDLAYFPSDAFIISHIEEITASLQKHNIPSFTFNEFCIIKPQTALFAVVANMYTLGQLTASVADQILFEGKKASEIPVSMIDRFSVVYRKDTLKNTKSYPNLSFLELAQPLE